MKRILITGGSGLLGKALINALDLKDSIILAPQRKDLDLTDNLMVKGYFESNRIDLILHCAAVVGGIQANIENPYYILSTNLKIDLNILEASISHEIGEFIYFGSSCMYPRDSKQPMSESQIMTGKLEPTNEAYALGKLVSAEMLRTISEKRGWSYKTIVLSNLYGSGQSEDPQESHLIGAIHNKFKQSRSSGSREIDIWGLGLARREFTHVNDVATWISGNLHRFSELPQVLNLGYGTDFSINDYYQFFSDVYGGDFSFIHDLSKPEGMPAKLLDSSVAAMQFGWAPQISPYDGIHKLIRENG